MKQIAAAIGLAAIIVLAPASGQAQTVSYGEAVRALVAQCGADIEAQCSGVMPGSGQLVQCLMQKPGVSPGCKGTVEQALASLAKRAGAQEAVAGLCQADARRLCADFRQGRARILRCLTRVDNRRKVSNKCNQAITDAGWR